ncbi:MAG: fibrobacter succinogenes major paralogous domain-containing protein [Prolixibacteraceae bacterium]|jgi:uncharacterized protein (TIGR02145 family)|nr:fibrobacter succinogenes major paralogous domain-containing protein [Prolixibacteraceae bacterium]
MKKIKEIASTFPVVIAGLMLLLFFGCKKEIKIEVPATIPVLTTNTANITTNSADIDGKVTSNGGSAVTTQGICWGINENPTIAGSKTSIGTGSESFTIKIKGLSPGTTYYVRSYATNSTGTGYGDQKSFQTFNETLNEIITDSDGNRYHSVTIGTQVWMVENLRTTKYRDGTPLPNVTDGNSWGTLTTGAYCWCNNDGPTNKNTYGALYNWYAINTGNLCPTGWHVPTTVEWTTLTDYLGGLDVAGGKLKQTGTTGWADPNAGATNETGFTAVGGGSRNNTNGAFAQIGTNGYWWSATESTTTGSLRRGMGYPNASVTVNAHPKNYGLSVRCIKDVVSNPVNSLDYRFDGSISQQVLQNYLSRAIHMGHLCQGIGNSVDNLRMLKSIGAKFAGRVFFMWGGESQFPQLLQQARDISLQVHANDPDIILEGAILECVTPDVDKLPIPAYVFQDFGLPVEKRNFRCADMLYINNQIYDTGKVPDITYQETMLWFYYLATSYIDIGLEAIHWGVMDAMGGNDKPLGWKNYYDLFARVRAYAKIHARRHYVLNNGDVYRGIVVDGKLLFDFHSAILHSYDKYVMPGGTGIKEVTDKQGQCILTSGYNSYGGITPSGWSCTRLPYITHLDNSGRTGVEGVAGQPGFLWGYDEISWFAHQPEAYRNEFLRYADNYISNYYPDQPGHLEMPGIRVINPDINANGTYFANSSSLYPWGFNQEETIHQIWAGK